MAMSKKKTIILGIVLGLTAALCLGGGYLTYRYTMPSRLLRMAHEAYDQGHYTLCQIYLERIISKDVGSEEAFRLYYRSELKQKHYRRAAQILIYLWSLNPLDDSIKKDLVALSLKHRIYPALIYAYERGKKEMTLQTYVDALIHTNDVTKLQQQKPLLIEAGVDSDFIALVDGHLLMNEKKTEEAALLFEEALNSADSEIRFDALNGMGAVQRQRGAWREMVRCLQAADSIRPNTRLLDVCMMRDEYAMALDLVDRLFDTEENELYYWICRAECYAALKRLEDVEAIPPKMSQSDPSIAAARNYLTGIIAFMKGDDATFRERMNNSTPFQKRRMALDMALTSAVRCNSPERLGEAAQAYLAIIPTSDTVIRAVVGAALHAYVQKWNPEPDDPRYADVLNCMREVRPHDLFVLRARLLAGLTDAEKAEFERLAQQTLLLNPESRPAVMLLADIAEREHNPKKFADLSTFLKQRKINLDLAEIFDAKRCEVVGNTPEALKLYNQAWAHYPSSPAVFHACFIFWQKYNQHQTLRSQAENVLNNPATDSVMLAGAARSYAQYWLAYRQADSALKCLEKVLPLDVNNELFYDYIDCALRARRLDLAADFMAKAPEALKTEPKYLLFKAHVMRLRSDDKRAVAQAYQQAYAAAPESMQAGANYSEALSNSGLVREGLILAHKIFLEHPESAFCKLNYVYRLFNSKQEETALPLLEELYVSTNADTPVRYALIHALTAAAEAAQHRGDNELAKTHYTRLLHVEPRHEQARMALEYLKQ